jgi:hypothetical protein
MGRDIVVDMTETLTLLTPNFTKVTERDTNVDNKTKRTDPRQQGETKENISDL